MLWRRTSILLIVGLIACATGLLFSRSQDSALTMAELAARDYLVKHGRKTTPNPALHFLAIDNDSISIDAQADLKALFGIQDDKTLEGRALGLMSAHWPWARSVYALILDRLIEAGASVVVFDLNFPTPSADDEVFRAALERYRDRVVIGSNFVSSGGQGRKSIDATLTLPTTELIPQTQGRDSRVGFVNFWPDVDGVVREARFRVNFAQFLGTRAIPGENDSVSLAAQAVIKSGHPELVPSDLQSRPFRMTAEPGKGFPPRSLFEIFVPEYWQRNYRAGADFKGAIVVVGAAGNWQHDEHQTAFGVMSGPEIQLNVINALLHREFIQPVSGQVALAIWAVAALAAVGCCLLLGSPIIRLGLVLLAGAAWVGLQFLLFNRAGVFIPIVGPLALLGTIALFSIVYDLVRSAAEQLRLRRTLIERKRAEELLQSANEELERRVEERTIELSRANKSLTSLLGEKDVLLKEIHHRVKNNLQIISSLLNLQSGYIKDPEALQVFTESRNRVRSMALIHEKLYQSTDLSRIDFSDYIKSLTTGLVSTFAGNSRAVRIAVEIDQIMLGIDSAVPCGLIVNELVTNCFKYAFKTGQPGEIKISLDPVEDEKLRLRVSDNGVGFPKGVDFRNTESLGMQIVTTLTEQMDGNIALLNGSGTTFEIVFPERK